MGKLLINPFKFGDPVEGDYYLPRPEMEALVTQFVVNRIHIVLIGPRRFGKTSFLLNLLKKLNAESYSYIFVDIFNITSIEHSAYAFQTLLNSLTVTQQRALRLAAKEGKQIFAKEFLRRYEISSGPALSSAIKALRDKEILDEDNTNRGTVIFDDPLFAVWLRASFD